MLMRHLESSEWRCLAVVWGGGGVSVEDAEVGAVDRVLQVGASRIG